MRTTISHQTSQALVSLIICDKLGVHFGITNHLEGRFSFFFCKILSAFIHFMILMNHFFFTKKLKKKFIMVFELIDWVVFCHIIPFVFWNRLKIPTNITITTHANNNKSNISIQLPSQYTYSTETVTETKKRT